MDCVSNKGINGTTEIAHRSRADLSDGTADVIQHACLDQRTPIFTPLASAAHPSNQPQQGLPRQRLQRASSSRTVTWSRKNFQDATKGQEWCRKMRDEQIDALVHFMNIVGIRKVDEIGDALAPAMIGGRRPAFEAVCAVYQSGIGDINERTPEGRTCLHAMAQNMPDISEEWDKIDPLTADGHPPVQRVPLTERFERAFMLGANPFLVADDRQSPIDVANRHGCLEQLLRGMREMTCPTITNNLFTWKTVQGQNILSVAARYGHEALAGIRKVVATEFCGDLSPQNRMKNRQSSSILQTLDRSTIGDWSKQCDATQLAVLRHYMDVSGLINPSYGDVINALSLSLAAGDRDEFNAAYEVYASGFGDINGRNSEGHTPLDQLALNEYATLEAKLTEPLIETTAKAKPVDVKERLAVMLGLGADPFSTGVNGNSVPPYDIAIAQKREDLVQPMSKIRAVLQEMAIATDAKHRAAMDHASSAEAVNFLCDLAPDLQFDFGFRGLTTYEAVLAWCKRNPIALNTLKKTNILFHPMFGATEGAIEGYLEAVKTRNAYDDTYRGDAEADLREILAAQRDMSIRSIWRQTLFASSISPEAANIVLHARVDARRGEPATSWDSWCEQEWRNLFLNYDSEVSYHQPLPSIELANLLIEGGALPPEALLAEPNSTEQWTLYNNELPKYRAAKVLISKIQSAERNFGNLNKDESTTLASQAYRVVLSMPPEQCLAYCEELHAYLTSHRWESHSAFLQTAQAGRRYLGKAAENAVKRKVWTALVKNVANQFFKEGGTLPTSSQRELENSLYVRQLLIKKKRSAGTSVAA